MITTNLTSEYLKNKKELLNELINDLDKQLYIKDNYQNLDYEYKDSPEYEKLFSTLVMLKNKLNKFSDDVTSELELMTLV